MPSATAAVPPARVGAAATAPPAAPQRPRRVQQNAIRQILAECRGLVAWGGDFDVPAPSHFEIAVGPQDHRLAVLAGEFRARNDTASATPGVTV